MSTNVPNLKQIGGGHRKNGQKFVDLMWNDPKPKRKRRAEKSNIQSIRKEKARFNFDFSACLGDDVTQNVSARHCARETQQFLA